MPEYIKEIIFDEQTDNSLFLLLQATAELRTVSAFKYEEDNQEFLKERMRVFSEYYDVKITPKENPNAKSQQ